MLQKVVSVSVEITQDDIDYLKRRACESLVRMRDAKCLKEKVRQWKLFVAYNGFYEANKDRLKDKYSSLKFDASPEDFKRARELGLSIDFAMGYIFYIFPDGSAVKI